MTILASTDRAYDKALRKIVTRARTQGAGVEESGRTIRIVSNLMLQEAGYPIAIVHSIDRQRYYESLRGDHIGLTSLYLEAVQTTAETEMRVYDEAAKGPAKRKKKSSTANNG